MAKYIENVSFFISHELNIQTEELKASRIFQSYNDLHHTQKIKDKELIKDLHKHLQKEEKNNISIDKITLTLSIFGICNLRIFCTSDKIIDADNFSFDNKLADVYVKLVKFFEEKGITKKESDLKEFFEKVAPDSRYLYHQHIADSDLEPSIAWSVYTYSANEVSIKSLDLDSLLLERNVLNYVFSRCYVQLLDEEDIPLSSIQKLLNANRKALAEHELLLHELEGRHFKKFNDDAPIQRLDDAAKLHDRLEENIEHLSEQKEDDRRHNDSIKMERIFLVLALIGLVSVITGLLALLPGRSDAGCDTNTTDFLLSDSYSYALGIPGNAVIAISVGLFVVGLWMIFKPRR